MISLLFGVGAVILIFVGSRLVKKGSAFTRKGGDAFTKKRRLRTIGQTLWVAAGILVVLALFHLSYSGSESTVDVPSPESTTGKPQTNPAPEPASPPHRVETASTPPPSPPVETAPRMETPPPSPANVSAAPENPPMSTPPAQVETAPVAPFSPPATPANLNLGNAKQQVLDAEMAKANAILQKDPSNVVGYERRGNVYGQEKMWDLATKDYRHALEIKSNSTPALFNLAEIDFLQKKYDSARTGFVALQKDPDFSDLASYKVFLCDLAGGHEEAAAKELDAFNQAGSNASYYFANVAWSATHQQPADAKQWLASAMRIYSPSKITQYATSLFDLGYLPSKPNQM
jgi:hypothetical protein